MAKNGIKKSNAKDIELHVYENDEPAVRKPVMPDDVYEKELKKLQIELVKLQE